MNTVIITGRLTRDPDIRESTSGIKIARFTVAVDRPKKQGEEKSADYISCIAFRMAAELIEKYWSKGKPISLIGHLRTDSYEKDGAKVYTTDVIADKVEFALTDRTTSREPAPADFSETDIPF